MLICPGIKRFREKDDNIEQLDAETDNDIKVANDVTPPIVEDTVSQVSKRCRFLISRFVYFIIILFSN